MMKKTAVVFWVILLITPLILMAKVEAREDFILTPEKKQETVRVLEERCFPMRIVIKGNPIYYRDGIAFIPFSYGGEQGGSEEPGEEIFYAVVYFSSEKWVIKKQLLRRILEREYPESEFKLIAAGYF